jgi:hypothetical protein
MAITAITAMFEPRAQGNRRAFDMRQKGQSTEIFDMKMARNKQKEKCTCVGEETG